ncbi:hypothetical protein JF66_18575, partial [Cryobacterium sp. MLB-32]|uniref:ABC transporter permease n=1 Tax=Cryobacterium sp. MLB-32 TaxID=1529318 RepID=UPI0004E77A42
MSTLTHPLEPSAARASFVPTGPGISFIGLLRSETIKLWSLRSTYWTFSLVVVASLGLAVLMSFAIAGSGPVGGVSREGSVQAFILVSTIGMLLGQLIVAVLGVLSISGEYSSGMIKSTLTAVPNRLPALWAKVAVLFGFTFLVGLISVVGSFLVAMPILGAKDITASLFDVDLALPLL